MMLDTGAFIGLVSLVVTLVVTAFGAGVAIGRHREQIDRLTHELDAREHRNTQKNNRR